MPAEVVPKTLLHRQRTGFRRIAVVLGRRVRALRQARSWTVEDAAERFGIEPAHVRRIEAGRTNPSLAVLVSVAAAFGVTLGELFSERGRPRSRAE